MKQLTSHLLTSLVSMALLLAGCTSERTDQMSDEMAGDDTAGHEERTMTMDPVAVNPDVYKTRHVDERVRILEMTLPAGVNDGMHSHPDEAVYFISGSSVHIHLPEGDTLKMDVPDGAPLSHEAWTHSVENVGDSALVAVVVELMPGARDSAGVVAEGMGAAETSPDVYSVLLEDDRVRILEMRLPAGQSDNEHAHPAEAVYFLSGGNLKVHLPEGGPLEVEMPDGGTLSNESWRHRVENVGETDVHAVIVELKQTGGE